MFIPVFYCIGRYWSILIPVAGNAVLAYLFKKEACLQWCHNYTAAQRKFNRLHQNEMNINWPTHVQSLKVSQNLSENHEGHKKLDYCTFLNIVYARADISTLQTQNILVIN